MKTRWQADHTTRGALALITGLTTLMCLPDHFDYSTWPFTNGYVLLYGAALLVIWRMKPAVGPGGGLMEDALRWRDLGPGLRMARVLTAGLVVVLGALYVPHWIHETHVTGSIALASTLVVAAILYHPGSVRLGAIATAAIFLFIVASPLEYTNHVFLPVKGVPGHLTLGVGFAGLAAAALFPVRTRWVLVFLLVIGTALRVENLVQWPMDPLRRDMPVLMNYGIQSLLDGRFPYRMYFCSHDVPQTYLPLLYLTHLPFVALGLDMRWGQLACTLVTALAIYDWGRGNPGLRQVGLFAAGLFYMMPETIWSVTHAETPSYWMWGALFLGAVIHRRFFVAAILLGLTLGTRHFAYIMVPFAMIWYAWVVRSRREAYLYLVIAAVVACLVIMPFALAGPTSFVFGTFNWLNMFGETHRTWWHIYISYAPLFYVLKHESWLPWIQAGTILTMVAASVGFEIRGRRRGDETGSAWRPWWFMAIAYILFLMFNTIIWRYLHAMPIVFLVFLVLLKLQNRAAVQVSGSARVVRFTRRPLAYWLAAGALSAAFAGSLVYMGWAYHRSHDHDAVKAHADAINGSLQPGDLLVDKGLFNAWPIMEGAVFRGRNLPPDVHYVIRMRSQFPPSFRRVVYFDGVDLFDPDRDVPDLLTYMRYAGHEDGTRSRVHFFVNPRPQRIFWRLSSDIGRLTRAELTAEPAGVAIGQRRPGDRFFFHGAAPRGYFAGWQVIRSMFNRWTCVMAHPPGGEREIRLTFTVPEAGDGWLVTGLDDFALWASRPPVTINVKGPGLPQGGLTFTNPNEQGLYVWSLGRIPGGEYTASVSAPRPHQRVFCFDVALGELTTTGPWNQSGDIGM
ncbi:MAG: hypothetical protein JRG91_01340 [Deltaproteobacteria bacterium]|nr:hypothetical protein [Deltaproteobacteria bacterium]